MEECKYCGKEHLPFFKSESKELKVEESIKYHAMQLHYIIKGEKEESRYEYCAAKFCPMCGKKL